MIGLEVFYIVRNVRNKIKKIGKCLKFGQKNDKDIGNYRERRPGNALQPPY